VLFVLIDKENICTAMQAVGHASLLMLPVEWVFIILMSRTWSHRVQASDNAAMRVNSFGRGP
jgi:hypothetical protein